MNAKQFSALAENFAMQSATECGVATKRFRIVRATHLGMCFGVRDAIALARQSAAERPLTIFGELVHNPAVLEELRKRGIQFKNDPAEIRTEQVMITAHGASENTIQRLRNEGFEVRQATCPLVHVAHDAVRQLVGEGFFPVIIGKRDHVEVRGLTGDLGEFAVVLSEADIDALPEKSKFGVAAQTTQPIDKVRRLVGYLRSRFPQAQVRFADTVCQPTKLRQTAALELARHVDAVVVVGGSNSNNTRELVETCRRHCARVFHVQGPDELSPDWFTAAENVGLTAGTSTPDQLIDSVERRLEELSSEAGN